MQPTFGGVVDCRRWNFLLSPSSLDSEHQEQRSRYHQPSRELPSEAQMVLVTGVVLFVSMVTGSQNY